MKILEEEIDLREETRELQQTKAAIKFKDYSQLAVKLARTQRGLAVRTQDVVTKIAELPKGVSRFAKELRLLTAVVEVMDEAHSILARPETGPEAIAAETEAIELLLQSRRIQPKGGGGGGNSPGGGGTGTTDKTALALMGRGIDADAEIEARQISQSTGSAGVAFPSEFRDGLDKYFNRLENRRK
ncbi:MAG: hypothetical protein O3A00_13405 [Planctomycetota bacterium]|nr:hypothetical protein [Planctomycetota bacterium]